MTTAQDSGRVYALLADGTTVEIREARPEDFDAVLAMHEAMAPGNIYLRFFSHSRRSAEIEARRICRDPGKPGSAALLALLDGELVGVASYAGHPPRAGRGRVRGGRPHAPQGHRHPAARAPGLAGPEPPDHHVHGQHAEREHGHAQGVRRRRPARAAALRRRGLPADVPAAPGRGRYRAGHLPQRRGRTGEQRGRGQPAAHLRARVGRGDRRQPPPGGDRPDNPGEHPPRRVRGPPVHGEPAGPADQRRPVPGLRARPARARRPGRHRGARPGRARRGRAVRPARRALARGDHVRPGRRGLRRPARGVPPARHAAGGSRLLRRGRARHRPGRHVRRHPAPSRRGRAHVAVRRGRRRPGRPAVPARRGDLLVRLGGQQARRVRQRHADVVGTRRHDQAGRAVPGVVRQPAQVRPDGPPGRREAARAHRARRR